MPSTTSYRCIVIACAGWWTCALTRVCKLQNKANRRGAEARRESSLGTLCASPRSLRFALGSIGMSANDITHAIIGAAIKVHKALGPGLLESAYEARMVNDFHG